MHQNLAYNFPYVPESAPPVRIDSDMYVHTKSFQRWQHVVQGNLFCIAPTMQDTLAVPLAHQLAGHLNFRDTHKVLYLDCFWKEMTPSQVASRVATLRRDERKDRHYTIARCFVLPGHQPSLKFQDSLRSRRLRQKSLFVGQKDFCPTHYGSWPTSACPSACSFQLVYKIFWTRITGFG